MNRKICGLDDTHLYVLFPERGERDQRWKFRHNSLIHLLDYLANCVSTCCWLQIHTEIYGIFGRTRVFSILHMLYLPNWVGHSMRPESDCFTSLTYGIEHIAGNHDIWPVNKWITPSLKVSKRAPLPFWNSDTLCWENRIKWQLNWTDPPLKFPCSSHSISPSCLAIT